MPIRIAAIGMSHWHSLYDAAYLRHLAGMPDVQLVGLHDPSAAVAAKRAAALGNPPIFGNTFPRDGTDGEWKIAGRDAILLLAHGTIRLTTASGEETTPGQPAEPRAIK